MIFSPGLLAHSCLLPFFHETSSPDGPAPMMLCLTEGRDSMEPALRPEGAGTEIRPSSLQSLQCDTLFTSVCVTEQQSLTSAGLLNLGQALSTILCIQLSAPSPSPLSSPEPISIFHPSRCCCLYCRSSPALPSAA